MDKVTASLLKKGRHHYASRDFDKAEAYLSKVAEAGVQYADVFNMLGVIYHGRGQMALAQDWFEKALAINPSYIEAALNLAVTYNDVGQYEKAKILYTQITRFRKETGLQIEPVARGKLANMHANLGRAYTEVGDMVSAVAQFRQALALCPTYVDIRTMLGQALRDAGDLEAACEEFERAKVQKPGFLPARISLGMTYLALGDRELARRELKAVLELDSENVNANMYLQIADHMIAHEEALEAGVNVEVSTRPSTPPPPSSSSELTFDFDGKVSSVSSLGSLSNSEDALRDDDEDSNS